MANKNSYLSKRSRQSFLGNSITGTVIIEYTVDSFIGIHSIRGTLGDKSMCVCVGGGGGVCHTTPAADVWLPSGHWDTQTVTESRLLHDILR